MKKLIWLLLVGAAMAQAPGPDAHSGRFMAANYGQWQDQIISVPSAGQICLQNQQEVAADGSKFYPWNTNASLLVGAGATQETVSPTLFNFTQVPGGVCISATFTKTHVAGDQVSSGTFGLQEALNIAGNNGGGAVTVDIRWTNLGGTTTIKNAATVPSNTGIEDIRAGASSGGGSGTVSANNGSAGAVANYAAAGGSTTVGPDATLTDSGTTLTYGGSSVKIGTNPATTGALNLPNNVSIFFRNAANTSDVVALGVDNGNNVSLGTGAGTVTQITAATTNAILRVNCIAAPVVGSLICNNGTPLVYVTAPTIAAAGCGGSAASIVGSNTTAAFAVNVGTAPTSSGCTITLPQATTDWVCTCKDRTTKSTTVSSCEQSNTSASTTSVTLQIYSDVAVASAPSASDILRVSCFAY